MVAGSGVDTYTAKMITMTEACAKHLESMASRDGRALVGIRVAVRGGGCSGLSYEIDFEETQREDDLVFGDDIRIFVDPKSHPFLDGMQLDVTSGMIGTGFVFRNPNADKTCGCGSSFSV